MKNILIVVDVQNGFVRTDKTKLISRRIEKLLKKKLFDYVVATRFINQENSQYVKLLNWHGLLKENERSLVGEISQLSDKTIYKTIYTCVNKDFIHSLMAVNDGEALDYIFICGIDTDCCVSKIATDIFEYGIRSIVLTDYCWSNGGTASHTSGIRVLKRLIGETSVVQQRIENDKDIYEAILKAQAIYSARASRAVKAEAKKLLARKPKPNSDEAAKMQQAVIDSIAENSQPLDARVNAILAEAEHELGRIGYIWLEKYNAKLRKYKYRMEIETWNILEALGKLL